MFATTPKWMGLPTTQTYTFTDLYFVILSSIHSIYHMIIFPKLFLHVIHSIISFYLTFSKKGHLTYHKTTFSQIKNQYSNSIVFGLRIYYLTGNKRLLTWFNVHYMTFTYAYLPYMCPIITINPNTHTKICHFLTVSHLFMLGFFDGNTFHTHHIHMFYHFSLFTRLNCLILYRLLLKNTHFTWFFSHLHWFTRLKHIIFTYSTHIFWW